MYQCNHSNINSQGIDKRKTVSVFLFPRSFASSTSSWRGVVQLGMKKNWYAFTWECILYSVFNILSKTSFVFWSDILRVSFVLAYHSALRLLKIFKRFRIVCVNKWNNFAYIYFVANDAGGSIQKPISRRTRFSIFFYVSMLKRNPRTIKIKTFFFTSNTYCNQNRFFSLFLYFDVSHSKILAVETKKSWKWLVAMVSCQATSFFLLIFAYLATTKPSLTL